MLPALMKAIAAGLVVLVGFADPSFQVVRGCKPELKELCRDPVICREDICPDAVIGGKDFKDTMIKLQNQKRRQPYTNGYYGADMMKLQWDHQLAVAAQAWANHSCVQDLYYSDVPDCLQTPRYNSVGQIISILWGNEYKNETLAAEKSVEYWYSEIEATPATHMFPYYWNAYGSRYVQLVWSRSYRLGCAYIRKPYHIHNLKVWVVCNYAPSGNIMDGKVNVFEPSCDIGSDCRPGTKMNKFGLCELKNETVYREHVGIDTVPPSKKKPLKPSTRA